VGVEKDIWTQPNADFVPIFSNEKFMNLKTFDRADRGVMLYPDSLGVQPERQVGVVAEAFDSLRINVSYCEGEVLETKQRIIENALANEPLVARTKIDEERFEVTLEYPIKTINVNERDQIYQTDTGPILLPDLSQEQHDLISGMELAFTAFNSANWAEFLVRTKAPVGEGIFVYHYCRPIRLSCNNQVIRVCRS
jgi:hypothetical protein